MSDPKLKSELFGVINRDCEVVSEGSDDPGGETLNDDARVGGFGASTGAVEN